MSKEENNFFRLYFLCQKIVTQAVRLLFDSKVPGLDFFLFLNNIILYCDSPVNKAVLSENNTPNDSGKNEFVISGKQTSRTQRDITITPRNQAIYALPPKRIVTRKR